MEEITGPLSTGHTSDHPERDWGQVQASTSERVKTGIDRDINLYSRVCGAPEALSDALMSRKQSRTPRRRAEMSPRIESKIDGITVEAGTSSRA